MRMLLLTALLLAHAGAARAEAGVPSAAPAKPARAQKAGAPKGAKARPGVDAKPGAQGKVDAKAKADPGSKPAGEPANKPCEPVKPCPIE